MLHGPAAARVLEQHGDFHPDVIDAVRFHTTGRRNWCAAGRALFCADFLEPGRSYLTAEHLELSEHFPSDPDSVFTGVVRLRIARVIDRKSVLQADTVELWNEIALRSEGKEWE
jgi:2-amino-4-hydroxy-6-hydroxymethyldihydropteridine diphosphokinase